MENIVIKKHEAVELDLQIKAYANLAWQNLMESAKLLKKMRDTKLYEELGYQTFEDYTQDSLNIKERQAYTYISAYEKLGERFLQSNANLGITKLSLLSQIPPTERETVIEENDISNMSVEEVKRLVEENDARGEQITLLEEQLKEEKEDNASGNRIIEELENKVEFLEKELKSERSKPTEVAVAEPSEESINKITSEIEKKIKKEADAEIRKAKKELTDKLTAEKERAVEDAKRKAEESLEEYKTKISEIDVEKREAIKKAEALEKELAVSSSPETVKFTFYFEALSGDYDKIFECIDKLKQENPEMAEKYKTALKRYNDIILNRLGVASDEADR